MTNLPNITTLEVIVVSTGVLLFFGCPAVVAWADQRRRRREQASRQLEVPGTMPSGPEMESATARAGTHDEIGLASETPSAPVETPTTLSAAARAHAEDDVALAPIAIQPRNGLWRHSFRLQDLHDARLFDSPPAALRDDAERVRLWHEGERACDRYGAAVLSTTVHSPYPARARCLGAVEAEGQTLRLRFLLFPVVWPLSQNQAVAQAIFEIDPTEKALRGWVDALQTHELTEDNRRDIRACDENL